MTTLIAQTSSTPRTRRLGMLCAGVLAIAGSLLGGCGGSNNALLEANRALTDRNTALTQQNDSLNRLNQELQAALAARDRAIAELQSLVADLRSGRSGLEGKLSDLEARLGGMKFGNMALDAETDAALRDLAAQYPDMLEFDSVRGLLRFRADVTFDSGSDKVKDAARPTLRQFAQILNAAAARYDVRIVGHTDSQPIRSAAQRGHPTNMHLSCHRAISVRNELTSNAVAAERVEAAGRGEFDPLVPNTSSGNTPRNRRVEVYLTRPSRAAGTAGPEVGSAPSAPAAAPAPTQPSKGDEIMK